MIDSNHYRSLERMYLQAPLNKVYKNIGIQVEEASATISYPVDSAFFHAAGALHGSVYFRLLDDACFFAANSIVADFFVLTSSFTIQFTRPVSAGNLVAKGILLFRSENYFVADAELVLNDQQVVGKGTGTFVKSKTRLDSIDTYKT